MADNQEVILKVEHLCQYFKMGHGRYLKAVDDVSFDVKKGEVFGLVGESGCGKTTTGRSIIKLYDITGGSVYFKGHRICGGVSNYKPNIAKAKKEYKEKLKRLEQEKQDELNGGANAEEVENMLRKRNNFSVRLRSSRTEALDSELVKLSQSARLGFFISVTGRYVSELLR